MADTRARPTSWPDLALASYRAEWLKLRHRPATWVLGLILFASIFALGYALLYVGILLIERGDGPDGRQLASDFLRADMAPAQLVSHILPLLNQLGGPIGLILGALALGSEYGWGTVKTILSQQPGRLSLLAGKLLGLAALLVLFTAGAFVAGLLGSLIFSAILGSDLALPSALALLRGLAAGWLILAVWTMLGAALATTFGNTALAIGLGLIYALVIENIVGTVAIFVDQIRDVRRGFLGANTGALADSFAPGTGAPLDPGAITASQAILVLLIYLLALAALAAIVLRRRDVA